MEWNFETAKFAVVLNLTQDYGYQYDGDDENGETQAALDSGEYIAFDSEVKVYLRAVDGIQDRVLLGASCLGGSVYAADEYKEFFTAHRSADPMNRNCSIMRAARGGNGVIGHYFPDMVREAIDAARETLATMPRLREVA